ncbi:hypothetical protein [Flavobacterium sp. RSP15]|uniref:hypothetical protein n=1 Tax=Flavobacterium sp. RSP15 TaxID=2497485 RepID=UPI000F83BE6F|nr:hypothetical protein [Flavobacterium sp. RSP15]RTY85518.1 hypothetical protein EKM00_14245 [Flavobacterium sp. RSP15]
MIAFGTVAGGAGAALTGGNFWQGAATGLVVSGLNHGFHNGKKINDNGGDTTDYNYDDDGNIIGSTSVEFKGAIAGNSALRGYGFKGFRMANGAISEDNSFVGGYASGKVIGTGLNYLGKGLNTLKIPIARYVGAYIGEFAPALNKGSGFRIGISKANIPGVKGTQMVFRATYGNNQNHFFNIKIGKWGG